MKFAVIRFPGSNCDQDCVLTLNNLPGASADFVWHKDTSLAGFDAVIVPGGFSYGDYLRCGAIARFSPIMQTVKSFAASGGTVLGICNETRNVFGLMPHPERACDPALGSTDGMRRGMDVIDTGKPLSVPVGKGTLGRVFNVLGEPIDGRGDVPHEERWTIHRDPPPLERIHGLGRFPDRLFSFEPGLLGSRLIPRPIQPEILFPHCCLTSDEQSPTLNRFLLRRHRPVFSLSPQFP